MEQIRMRFRKIKMVSDFLNTLSKACKGVCVLAIFAMIVPVVYHGFALINLKQSVGNSDVKRVDLSFLGSDMKIASVEVPKILGAVEEATVSDQPVSVAQEVFFAEDKAGIDVAVVKDKVEVKIEPVVTITVASAVYNSNTISYTDEDLQVLERIIQAEAGNCDMIGKILVANVIINRVNSSKFPNNIKDVVFARNQFSPTFDGSYYSCVVSDASREAARRALDGEDYSQGALYFAMNSIADTCWAGRTMRHLFEHDGHTFFAP
jgi:hypothetical protein